ncbi:DUF4276 family protein [Flammeovirga aprica]|uniref:DUF4276 family protein n=1 Tax=Flammeovirga aprica JL-4 TaxID=694437 RepID=A0A7X9P1E2_9BACT|nr:DUF4276 family protein [Flammeovirga aprica]NME66597.1 DUF4276 family protein [Flammeovirga aprica JL-4]
MKRLVFIVEGDTELILVDKVIIPYLINQGYGHIYMNGQPIVTNRKLHKKGGLTTYKHLQDDIRRTLAQGDVIVTTLVDFYALPSNFPNYSSNSDNVANIEDGIHSDFQNTDNLIPYIQLHEVEALMFSSEDGLAYILQDEDESCITKVREIRSQYTNPEQINNSRLTAPSKRLENIYDYDKTGDGGEIFEFIGIEPMLENCPRFNAWIQQIILRLEEGH